MTAPSYTEDLTDLNEAESNTNWVEMTGTIAGEAYNANGIPAGSDADYPYIQGSFSVTQDCTKNTSVGSLAYNNSAGTGGHGTDGAYFVWQQYLVASNLGTYAQGGFQIVVGSGTGDFDAWYVGGVDKSPYPYGGWVNNVCNTTVTPDGTAGSPTATEQYVGSAVYVVTGSSKGEIHNVDVIRYGRGSSIFEFGDLANGYATIAGFATLNDNGSNRWGLIQETAGGYLWKGKMTLGTATNLVDFRDSNVNIFIQWTPKVTANFNTIEINNASSNIEIDGFNFTVLDTTTASRGRLLMNDQCDVSITNSTFVDMGTFLFDKGSTKTVTITNNIFTRCDQITHGGATMNGCSILASRVSAGSGALLYNETVDPDGEMDNMTFSQGTNAHSAIEFGTNVTSDITLRNIDFTGFGSTDDANGAVFKFLATTGSLNLNLVGCTTDGTFSVDDSAGITVTVVINPVTQLINVKDTLGNNLQDARVFLETAETIGGGEIYQATVSSLTSSAGTATCTTASAHGLVTGDKVVVRGAQPDDYNRVATVTVSSTTVFTYTVPSGISSPATGTPVVSFVAISGLTDESGNISASRTWTADQALSGWARKSTTSPFLKQGDIAYTVDSTNGNTTNVVLQPDE